MTMTPEAKREAIARMFYNAAVGAAPDDARCWPAAKRRQRLSASSAALVCQCYDQADRAIRIAVAA